MVHDQSHRSGRQTQRDLLTSANRAAVKEAMLHDTQLQVALTVYSSGSTLEHAVARQHTNECSCTLSAHRYNYQPENNRMRSAQHCLLNTVF